MTKLARTWRELVREKESFQAEAAVSTMFQRRCKDDPLLGAVSYSLWLFGKYRWGMERKHDLGTRSVMLVWEHLALAGDFGCLSSDELHPSMWKGPAGVIYLTVSNAWKVLSIFDMVKLSSNLNALWNNCPIFEKIRIILCATSDKGTRILKLSKFCYQHHWNSCPKKALWGIFLNFRIEKEREDCLTQKNKILIQKKTHFKKDVHIVVYDVSKEFWTNSWISFQ